MEANAKYVKHGWVWALSLLIFFFNYFLLPEGLSIVLLLTPLWFYLLFLWKQLAVACVLLLPLLLYAPVHLLNGVDLGYYGISITMIASVIFFVATLYFLLNHYPVNLDLIFKDIAILNFILAIVSIALLFIPALKETVWYMVPISENIKPIPRLKLFASEASHYSFLLAPVAVYFYSKAIFFNTSNPYLTLIIVTVPLLLSFSLGVLLGLIISFLLLFFIYFRRVLRTKQKRINFFSTFLLLPAVVVVLYHFFPGNPLFLRIHNIFDGHDTSARGRTYEAFYLAHNIAAKKSLWWGIGPGQLKLIGRNIVLEYYFYSHIPQTIRIPNACAETIAYFGYVGFGFRMLIELFLFVKTRVYAHPYRLWLFLFVFIYQFTGSYITNVSEYIIWILAFSNIFPEFYKNAGKSIQNMGKV